jgi:5'-nucleotidase / UDP-sugar diphosphatase
VVTSDYLAEGGDGYVALRDAPSVNTYLNYTQTFIDYLRQTGTISRPPAAEYSHQRVIAKDGRVLAEDRR